jgi:putative chitinase
MDRKVFYDAIRAKLGALSTANVAGFELFINEAVRRHELLASFAYVLATVWWETAKTMQPVREAYWVGKGNEAAAEAWRKAHLRYWPFYGRSYPQFTWEQNYKRATDIWNATYRGDGPMVDFVKNPDAIMDPKYGVPLTFHAMDAGWFTGKKLGDYIDNIDEGDAEDLREFISARRIVNGTDRQTEIGNLALMFEHNLRSAGY